MTMMQKASLALACAFLTGPTFASANPPISVLDAVDDADDVKLEAGHELNHFFGIRSKATGKFVDVALQGPDKGRVQTWDANGGKNQQFLFVPVKGEADTFYIICRQTGEFLDAIQEGDWAGWISTEGFKSPKDVDSDGRPNNPYVDGQKYKVLPLVDDHKKKRVADGLLPLGEFRLKCKLNGKFVDVALQGADTTGKVQQWDETGGDNQIWTLADPEEFAAPEPPSEPAHDMKAPELTSVFEPTDLPTEVTGVTWIAWPFVDDPSKSADWKMNHSPWYRLERTTSWSVIEHFHNDTEQAVTKEWKFESGWAEEVATSFSLTVGYEAQAGGESMGVTAKWSASFTASLSRSMSKMGKETDTSSFSLPGGKAATLFGLQDMFTLYRMDDDKVPGGPWSVSNHSATVKMFPSGQ